VKVETSSDEPMH